MSFRMVFGEQDQRSASWTGVTDDGVFAPSFRRYLNVFTPAYLVVGSETTLKVLYGIFRNSQEAPNTKCW
jgi:hypothetical protein